MVTLPMQHDPYYQDERVSGKRTRQSRVSKGCVPILTYRDESFTDEVAQATQSVWEQVHDLIPDVEWLLKAPLIYKINQLKRERRAIILAHNYQAPEIFYGVADFGGDSLELARRAATLGKDEAPIVVMCGVHFMAETVKVLSPERTVIIPDVEAGCSLAESITARDVQLLKQRYPGVPVVSYVNTSAEVKAESDFCCTSSNAVQIVEAAAQEFGTRQVIMLPDQYLAQNTAAKTHLEIISWAGTCMVHERFTPEQIRDLRAQFPGVRVLAHPECPPEVCAEADFVGSTSGMIRDVSQSGAAKVVMITECSMADNVAAANPGVDFVRPCVLCPHMQRITLPKILTALQTLQPQVRVPADVIPRARRAVERMLEVSNTPGHSASSHSTPNP
ncbi:MAG TPA: quinolinate synthase NadA [Gammaproteobacteria bacterium]|nr:quinolinate synthase NadA [Gammaproteobacteria bacterium]